MPKTKKARIRPLWCEHEKEVTEHLVAFIRYDQSKDKVIFWRLCYDCHKAKTYDHNIAFSDTTTLVRWNIIMKNNYYW